MTEFITELKMLCGLQNIFIKSLEYCNDPDEYSDLVGEWNEEVEKLNEMQGERRETDVVVEKEKNKINKYFNADEFLQKIQEHHYILRSFNNTKDYGMFECGIKQIVDEMPSADVVEVKHGEWETIDYDDGEYEFRCSNCRSQYDMPSKTNFCPNCGADMRERKDND